MFERKLTSFRKTEIKNLLRDYFNQQERKNFKRITNITRYFGFDNSDDTYQYLLNHYNTQVDIKQTQLKRYGDKVRRQFRSLQQNRVNEISIHIDYALNNGVDNLKKLITIIKRNYGNMFHNQQIIMTIGNTNYVLNDTTLQRLQDYIENNLVQTQDITESDGRVIVDIMNNDTLTFSRFVPVHQNNNHAGGFFKYFNLTKIDLKRYGVYTKNQWNNKNWNEGDECLVYALTMGGMKPEKINYLKTMIKDMNVPLSQLKTICEKLEINIELKRIECNKQSKDRFIYGKQFSEKYLIGFYDEHYFINEPVEYTSYSIKNYSKICDQPNFNKRCRADAFDEKRFITSYDLIKILVEEKTLLEKISFSNSQIAKTQYYKKVDSSITDLSFHKGNIKCVDETEEEYYIPPPVFDIKESQIFHNVFFDFETHTDNETKEHTPYLCCAIIQGKMKTFFGEDCGLQLLKFLNAKGKNIQLIAHNASYDYRFIAQYLSQLQPIMRGSRLLFATGKFNNIKIKVKCSYHLISMPLSDFAKTFGLKSEKEIMPYSLYNTNDNIKKQFIPLNECLSHLTYQIEKDKFFENAKKWKCFKDGKIDIIKYSQKYCEMDCVVLRDGYNIFRTWIDEMIQLDIDEIVTTASLAHKFFIAEGCYRDVKQFSGVLQMFIQKCVVGGRTMCSENKKHIKQGKVNDFDAVSLYPSAMYRLDGFLKGIPKIIEDLNFENIKNKDGYFIEIVIKSVGIKRKFPLISNINEDGVRIFSNDMIGKTIFVDKIALEDMIKFQDIDFDVIRGYYFDEGFNTQIKDTIKFLFEERAKLKKQGNKAEMIYKLLMNSGYGKSIMKPIEEEVRVFDNKNELDVYIGRNYNWIKNFVPMKNDKTILKSIKSLNEHFNIAHIGVSILSMSKRIMNEVMCLGEDLKIDMFYQDTDSIHLYDKDIDTLRNAYNEKYGRELIGKNMGQFHSDFDGEIYCDENGNIISDKKYGKKFGKKISMKDVYAVNSIFLGKKCYIDELECIGEDNKKYTDYHIRMKGIPNSCILYTSKKLGYDNPLEMYKDLYNGKTITFDLTEDGNKDNFEMKGDYTITTKKQFCRDIKF
jgi:hypothetical protein